jgi:coproporphyrinogen III oxidase
MASWIKDLRNRICESLAQLERSCAHPLAENLAPGVFTKRPWLRRTDSGRSGGGGEMSILKNGRVFEKAGVNISTVSGEFSPLFRQEIKGAEKSDGQFWAAGLSMVIHPRSPLVPAFHMNCRMISTSQSWFGGVADLNPAIPFQEDTETFHSVLKNLCDQHPEVARYPLFRDNCHDYFYIKHRDRHRGVGGIFFDDIPADDSAFLFTQNLGESFFDLYPPLVERHMDNPWTSEQRAIQLHYRGLYAEFNLIYDRGTRFGLMTGANPEAVLMSLPPIACWS